MANRISEAVNAFETNLAASVDPSTSTALLTTVSGLQFPTYLVLDPDIPGKREVVYATSVVGATITMSERYLEGSSLPSGITHDAGSIVRAAVAAQFIEDLHDRIDAVGQGHDNFADDDHTQYLNTGRHDSQSRHQPGTSIGTAIGGASAPGDSAAEGSATSFSRSDHRHGREGFGTPGASAPGDTIAAGVAGTLARSDHRHGREAASPTAGVKAFNSIAVSIASGSDVLIGWNSEEFDSNAFHDNSVNNSRLTVPSGLGGKYLVHAQLMPMGDLTDNPNLLARIIRVRKNNAAFVASAYVHVARNSIVQTSLQVTSLLELVPGDFLEVYAQQPTGGSLQVIPSGGAEFAWFELHRVGA